MSKQRTPMSHPPSGGQGLRIRLETAKKGAWLQEGDALLLRSGSRHAWTRSRSEQLERGAGHSNMGTYSSPHVRDLQ